MTFNTKRFVQTVKWTEATCLNRSVKMATAIAVVLFLITLMSPYGSWVPDSIKAVAGTANFTLAFFFVALATNLTTDMNTRQGRLFAMMLPASPLEKYLARLLHVTVGTLLISAVATVAADALSMVYRLATQGQLPSSLTWAMLTDLFYTFCHTGDPCQPLATVTIVVTWTHIHAFFVLGGTFFRRGKLPLTGLAAFALMLLSGFSVLGLMGYGWPFEFSTAYVIDQNSLIIGFNVVVLLLTVLYHLAAYQLFRRMQLINNKWVNL